MNWSKALRWLGSVAAAVALTGAGALPAAAQPDPDSIDVFIPDVAVAAGETVEVDADVTVEPSGTTLEDPTLTFDLSGLAGVATVSTDNSFCATSGTDLVCEPPDDQFGSVRLAITGDPAAAVGTSGTLTATAEAAGVAPTTYEATVTVAAPVDLVGGGALEHTAEPGDGLLVPLTVRNAGPEPAHGVRLALNGTFTVQLVERHSNCTYGDSRRARALCTFDVVLEPGTTYALDPPVSVEVGTDTAAPGLAILNTRWMTPFAAGRVGGTPGTDPEVILVDADGDAPAPLPDNPVPTVDVDPTNDGPNAEITVEGDNQPDFAAVGAELAGDAGETRTVEVGVTNVGPAVAEAVGSGEPVNRVRVTLPEGTTAEEVPERCVLAPDSPDTGPAAYRCNTGPLMLVDETVLFPFVLRIDEEIPDATGLVQVNRAGPVNAPPREDADPANDEAEILVNPTGGTGGGLPVTGTPIWAVAAAGALLVGLGGGALLLVRRRRTQFLA